MTHRKRRTYDHRVKAQIIATGNPHLFPELQIPLSTCRSWMRRGVGAVMTVDAPLESEAQLRHRIVKLERRVAILAAVLGLVLALLRVSGFKLEMGRVPDAQNKRLLLGAVERARKTMPLARALRVIGLSASRYHDWVGIRTGCSLTDRSSCPRSKPQRLTHAEVETIGDMVQSREHRHMSIRGLALHAQRVGRVFAHPATWAKLIRERGWRRPRLRLHPPKPKVGFRATAPNEAWHVDVTIIKLLDGTKAYLHGVIDNFSRRILAWTVADRLDPMNTCRVLAQAASNLQRPDAKVYMDSGVENLNKDVDALFSGSALQRIIAQIDVSFSNSLIEAWWRSLKFQWLFLHHLDNLATLRRLIEFYVVEHNRTIPHNAFRGQTPDEMYFGRGSTVPDELAERRREARKRRVEQNRRTACTNCRQDESPLDEDIAA
ncbi:MAG: DDE-type integrase/transposase/recombinase [Polyangiaceae bacterium]|nr:DDE-type integrase/transposase/recombinase [Polyangiaceae bacterium]